MKSLRHRGVLEDPCLILIPPFVRTNGSLGVLAGKALLIGFLQEDPYKTYKSRT